MLLTPPTSARHHIGLRGSVLIPLRVTHTFLLRLNKPISPRPSVRVALLDMLQGEGVALSLSSMPPYSDLQVGMPTPCQIKLATGARVVRNRLLAASLPARMFTKLT